MSTTPILGQVCDRCRQKKIKCDGKLPSCSTCVSAGVSCDASTKLQRKTKIRGFFAPDAERVRKLEEENAELRKNLQQEKAASQLLRDELDRQNKTINDRPRKVGRMVSTQLGRSPGVSASGESEKSANDPSAQIIKHMGRLINDQQGIGRFAGSTTGVHFVLSVEDACRHISPTTERFPESSFNLHVLQHNTMLPASALVNEQDLHQSILRCFVSPLSYYKQQIEVFNQRWASFCPVVLEMSMIEHMEKVLWALNLPAKGLSNLDYATVHAMTSIMLINRIGEHIEGQEDLSFYELDGLRAELACRLHIKIASMGDLFALQALALFSFYIQLTGQRLWLVQLNGLMVQLAQSLGLHRHARRFKFCISEVEFRKRLWWWIYCFDKITSIVHGLPKLINDADVDTPMPTDCDIDDITSDRLSHPLPGEPSAVSIFVIYAQLGQILSTILDQLYTTTRRRGGAEKITRIDRDLKVWNFVVRSHPHIKNFDIGTATRVVADNHQESMTHVVSSWLLLISNIAMLLVHRPGLTFDPRTKRFRESLDTCISCCTTIVDLMENNPLTQILHNICPAGSSIAFQCGLMHIFYHVSPPGEFHNTGPSRSESLLVILRAVGILREYGTPPAFTPPSGPQHYNTQGDRSYESIAQAAQTLQNLSDQFLRDIEHSSTTTQTVLPTDHNDITLGQGQQDQSLMSTTTAATLNDPNQSSNLDFTNVSSLENLNHLSDFDWMFDESGTFATVESNDFVQYPWTTS